MSDWMIRLIEQAGYIGIAFLMFLENIIPPIPSEVIMGLAGIKAGQGQYSVPLIILWGTVGTVLGNYVWFLLGRWLGLVRFKPLVDRFGRWLTLDWAEVEKMNALFLRFGAAIVFFARFIPTIRTLISIPAGMFRMGHMKFLLWTAAGSTIWNSVLVLAGYYLGDRFEEIDKYVGPLAMMVMVSVVAIYIYRLITWRPAKID